MIRYLLLRKVPLTPKETTYLVPFALFLNAEWVYKTYRSFIYVHHLLLWNLVNLLMGEPAV
jgi:hypothetical protein